MGIHPAEIPARLFRLLGAHDHLIDQMMLRPAEHRHGQDAQLGIHLGVDHLGETCPGHAGRIPGTDGRRHAHLHIGIEVASKGDHAALLVQFHHVLGEEQLGARMALTVAYVGVLLRGMHGAQFKFLHGQPESGQFMLKKMLGTLLGAVPGNGNGSAIRPVRCPAGLVVLHVPGPVAGLEGLPCRAFPQFLLPEQVRGTMGGINEGDLLGGRPVAGRGVHGRDRTESGDQQAECLVHLHGATG